MTQYTPLEGFFIREMALLRQQFSRLSSWDKTESFAEIVGQVITAGELAEREADILRRTVSYQESEIAALRLEIFNEKATSAGRGFDFYGNPFPSRGL